MKGPRRIAAILVLSLVATLAVSAAAPTASGFTLPRIRMLQLINARRRAAGEQPLQMMTRLVTAARSHSRYMAERGYIFHTANLAVRLQGLNWRIAGENVGAGGTTVLQMFWAFWRSAPHRHNMMLAGFRHVGIGMVRSRGYLWVTMEFYG